MCASGAHRRAPPHRGWTARNRRRVLLHLGPHHPPHGHPRLPPGPPSGGAIRTDGGAPSRLFPDGDHGYPQRPGSYGVWRVLGLAASRESARGDRSRDEAPAAGRGGGESGCAQRSPGVLREGLAGAARGHARGVCPPYHRARWRGGVPSGDHPQEPPSDGAGARCDRSATRRSRGGGRAPRGGIQACAALRPRPGVPQRPAAFPQGEGEPQGHAEEHQEILWDPQSRVTPKPSDASRPKTTGKGLGAVLSGQDTATAHVVDRS
mmetsp:Transcript_24897/g.56788  ORF Transcript_24897/g.56788 Transcript_24897/m.56788 type:complete len:264 (+) Transcript_24897:155-946(+)